MATPAVDGDAELLGGGGDAVAGDGIAGEASGCTVGGDADVTEEAFGVAEVSGAGEPAVPARGAAVAARAAAKERPAPAAGGGRASAGAGAGAVTAAL